MVAAKVDVSHLTPLELKRELHLVALFEELAGVVDLDHQIMLADAHGLELQLLELTGAARGPRLVLFLLLLVAPFAVIHDSTNGRASGGSDFNKVKPGLARHTQGFCG
jgi:hypothetical protein